MTDDRMFVLGLLALATVVVVALVWQIFAVVRTQVSAAAGHGSCRELAERVADALERVIQEQRKMAEAVAEIRTRVAAIERGPRRPG